jgi:putative DNA primase/helicase
MSAPFMKSAEIHALVDWPATLVQLGVLESMLRNKHGPCPVCGGKDRFRFDNKYNKHGDGGFFCTHCRPGDGFKLLMLVHGWTFAEARKRVMETGGLQGNHLPAIHPARLAAADVAPIEVAVPTERVLGLRRERRAIENCPDAMAYFASRGLWPLPPGCTLWAHPKVKYWERVSKENQADVFKLVGRFPALVADVLDIAGETVALHVTWLHQGKKLAGHQSRKLLGKMTDRVGCAVQLMPAGDVLGIAEGIETALSAALLDDIPVWAATNAGLLARFEPPPGVLQLLVYADRDKAGQEAADKLKKRLHGRVQLETRTPPAPLKDWNDVLIAHNSRTNGNGDSNE